MSFQGKLNIYTCTKCGWHIVTIDVDDGVTPFTIGCRSALGCDGWMQSSMYRVFDPGMKPSHEWYRPGALQILTDLERRHVDQGGLLLRPFSGAWTPPVSERRLAAGGRA